MGELLILALGPALYTGKHCLDKAANVGSIPTSPTNQLISKNLENFTTMKFFTIMLLALAQLTATASDFPTRDVKSFT